MITKKWSYEKKFSIIFLAVVMSFSFIVNAFAASTIDPVTIDYGDRYTLKVSTVDISTFTVREKTITRQADAYHGSTYIGTFYLTGTFQYDARKAVATSDSWRASSPSYSYSGKSSHSGASVSGSCTFNYLGSKTYKLTMTCDKNGNMTYTQ